LWLCLIVCLAPPLLSFLPPSSMAVNFRAGKRCQIVTVIEMEALDLSPKQPGEQERQTVSSASCLCLILRDLLWVLQPPADLLSAPSAVTGPRCQRWLGDPGAIPLGHSRDIQAHVLEWHLPGSTFCNSISASTPILLLKVVCHWEENSHLQGWADTVTRWLCA
jgi:hypothetical protein